MAILSCWPAVVIACIMTYLAGVVVWVLVSYFLLNYVTHKHFKRSIELTKLFKITLCCIFTKDMNWNHVDFPKSFISGSLEGVWWSFVTMTTVG